MALTLGRLPLRCYCSFQLESVDGVLRAEDGLEGAGRMPDGGRGSVPQKHVRQGYIARMPVKAS